MFLLVLSLTSPLPYDIDVLFPLPKMAAIQASWSVQPLLCWRGQGANWHENHIDLFCVQGKSGASGTVWEDVASAVRSLKKT